MQISSNASQCPFPHLHRAAGAAAPKTAPDAAAAPQGDFQLDEILCPVLKTGVNEGRIKVDAEGNATGLESFLKDDLAMGWMLRKIFVKGGKSATDRSDAPGDTINLRNLRGSNLDHTADSQILRNGFNQERLDLALSFSSDGERLTLADLGRFQQHLLGEEPGLKGKFVGGMEYAAVVARFGRIDGLGQRFISKDDFVSLFRDNKFPKGWETSSHEKMGLTDVALSAYQFFAEHPGDPASSAAPAKAGGVCPFKHGKDFDMDEAVKQHADKLF